MKGMLPIRTCKKLLSNIGMNNSGIIGCVQPKKDASIDRTKLATNQLHYCSEHRKLSKGSKFKFTSDTGKT